MKASAVLSEPPNTVSELRIVAVDAAKDTVVATQRGLAGQDGAIRLEAAGAVPPASTRLRIELTCDVSVKKKQALSIPLQASQGATSLPDAVTEGACGK